MFKETTFAVVGLVSFVVALIISFAPYAFVSDAQEVAETMRGVGGTALMVAMVLVGFGTLCHLIGVIAGINQLRLRRPINWIAMAWNLLVAISVPMAAISLGIVIV